MKNIREMRTDVAVIGEGATGLMLTKKLTDLGYDVALVGKQKVVGSGPSTRNTGWLQRGTYHAASLENEAEALEVAKTCAYGSDQIRHYAPAAIEDAGRQTSFAVIGTDQLAEQATQRWDKANIPYRSVSLSDFSKENPEIGTGGIKHAFKVDDVTINPRILYQKLLTQSKRGGAQVMLDSKFQPKDNGNAEVTHADGSSTRLKSDLFVVTAGYGVKDVFREVTGDEVPVRLYKSHLLVFPRLTANNVFHIDRDESMVFNHGTSSVMLQHHEDFVIDEPDFTVVPEKERKVFEAAHRLVPSVTNYDGDYMPIACIKPELIKDASQARSLDVTIFPGTDNYLFVLPGKLTATPYVTDRLTQIIFNKGSEKTTRVAMRPSDVFMAEGKTIF